VLGKQLRQERISAAKAFEVDELDIGGLKNGCFYDINY